MAAYHQTAVAWWTAVTIGALSLGVSVGYLAGTLAARRRYDRSIEATLTRYVLDQETRTAAD